MKDRIRQMLSHPSKFYAFGPKDNSLRLSEKLMIGLGLLLTVGGVNYGALHSDEHESTVVYEDNRVQALRWASLVQNPWSLPGLNADKTSFSAIHMTNAWKEAGLPASDLHQAYLLSSEFAPVLYGRTVKSLEEKRARNVASSEKELKDKWPDVYQNLISGKKIQLSSKQQEEWTQVQLSVIKEQAGIENIKLLFAGVPLSVSMPEARQHLQEAVQESGLSSLRLPLHYWSSPVLIEGSARRIKLANQQLQHLTGFQGQVLGLDGYVQLQIEFPYVENGKLKVDGYSVSTAEGGLVKTNWQALGHEWFHAMDNKIARRERLRYSPYTSMNDQAKNWFRHTRETLAMVEKNEMVKLMEDSANQLYTVAPDWAPRFQTKYETDPADHKSVKNNYVERLAHAFNGYLFLNQASALYEKEMFSNPKYINSLARLNEAEKQRDVFDRLFSELRQKQDELKLTTSEIGSPLLSKKPINPLQERRLKNQKTSHNSDPKPIPYVAKRTI